MRWLAFLVQFLLLSTAVADVADGESIYLQGLSDNGQMIKTFMSDLESGSPLACVNCHRESGLGTSESGKTIPPVSWSFLGKNQPNDKSSRFYSIQNKRTAYNADSLYRLLQSGLKSNGKQADKLMPRYLVSKQQTKDLITYLKTLFTGNDLGVDSDVIKIATIIDPTLSTQSKQQHLKFMQGLFDMKNARTRGELRRKKYSPIQKIPQYESYRHWELLSWELPDDPLLWKQSLHELYEKTPVFVVLSPQVNSQYSHIAAFCNEAKVPCLFPNTKDAKGDYYNFVFRDFEKQNKDYLDNKLREENNDLFYLNAQGQAKKINNSDLELPNISHLSNVQIHSEFERYCGSDITLILSADIYVARQFYKLNCSSKQKVKIKLLINNATSFEEVADVLKLKPNPSICLVTDYSKMLKRNTRKIRTQVMTRKFGMDDVNGENLAMDLYAYGVLVDAIHQLAGNFSRAYLMENIEHMLNSFPNYTYFNYLTGAPNQRAIVGPITEYCPSVGES